MNTPADYIAQPTEDRYDAWAVIFPGQGESIICGRPSSLRARGFTILCTTQERLVQIITSKAS